MEQVVSFRRLLRVCWEENLRCENWRRHARVRRPEAATEDDDVVFHFIEFSFPNPSEYYM